MFCYESGEVMMGTLLSVEEEEEEVVEMKEKIKKAAAVWERDEKKVNSVLCSFACCYDSGEEIMETVLKEEGEEVVEMQENFLYIKKKDEKCCVSDNIFFCYDSGEVIIKTILREEVDEVIEMKWRCFPDIK